MPTAAHAGAIAQQAGLSLDDDGAPPEGAGKDYERLVSAMEVRTSSS